MRVFLFGSDGVGWSIDADRKYTEMFLNDINVKITDKWIFANAVHAVWWNLLLNNVCFPLRYKKVMAVVTNDIDIKSPDFLKAKKFVNLWIAPNKTIMKRLEKVKVNVMYQPFYVDEKVFCDLEMEKNALAQELGIDYNIFRDKLIIGSFQRDSLGSDLKKPKPQKGPDILINILNKLSKQNKDFILLLAGPRRHWIINECKRLGIPYYFYGKNQNNEDDLNINTLNKDTINKLYNFIDLYIVSSKQEGGPKSVLESSFTQTLILSTEVGLAPDFLHSWCIYKTPQDAVNKIIQVMHNKNCEKIIKFNYINMISFNSYEPMVKRWQEIYDYFDTL